MDCWSVCILYKSKISKSVHSRVINYLWPSRIDIAIFGVRASSDYPKHKDNLHVDADDVVCNSGSFNWLLVISQQFLVGTFLVTLLMTDQ